MKILIKPRPVIFWAGLCVITVSLAFYIIAEGVDIAHYLCNIGITVGIILMACSLDTHMIVLTLILASASTTNLFSIVETDEPILHKMLYLLAALLVAVISYVRQLLSSSCAPK